MSDGTVLSCQRLTREFRQGGRVLRVLDELDFSVAEGERVAIVGASGSGKSTLLHLLGGLDRPTRGSVRFGDKDISRMGEARRGRERNRHLGFVYQFHHLLPEFSALENVMMPLRIRGVGRSAAGDAAAQMLTQVGLADRLTHKPAQLSGGERQRTAIARALVTRPACLLADEPTGNLDRKTAASVMDTMQQLNADFGVSLVVVTHAQELAQQMNRTLALEDGRFVA